MIETVGCDLGMSAKPVGNECVTRRLAYLERAGHLVGQSVGLVAGGDTKVAECLLVAGRDAKSQSVF